MRKPAMTVGLLLLAIIWFGPLLDAWRGSFTAHMVAHMGVVAIAAPLIALGLPDRWGLPARTPAYFVLLASLLELVAVWCWHLPTLREAVENSTVVTGVEQAIFLAVGVLLWTASFAAPTDRSHAAAGAFALLLTSMHMTLLGALLALAPRPLYGGGDVTCFGIVLDAGKDQQFGAVFMLLVGAVVYLAGGLALAKRLVELRESRSAGT